MIASSFTRPEVTRPVIVAIGYAFGSSRNDRLKNATIRAGAKLIILSSRYMHDSTKMDAEIRASLRSHGFVLPADEFAADLARKHGDHPRIASPSKSLMHAFEDKQETRMWMVRQGLRKYTLAEYDDTRHITRFPVILKPRYGRSGTRVTIVHRRRTDRTATGFFYQQAVLNTTEWSVHFSALQGKLLSLDCLAIVFADDLFIRRHKKTVGRFRRFGRETCPSTIRDMTSSIVQRAKYHGIGCFGIKYIDAQPKLIEINPRLCGLAVTYASGVIMTTAIRSLLERLNHNNLSRCCTRALKSTGVFSNSTYVTRTRGRVLTAGRHID